MAGFEIKTAEEFLALDVEGRGRARRAARQTPLFRAILKFFLERGGPVPPEAIAAALGEGAHETVNATLVALDADDLVRVGGDGHVDLAYPFSAAPTDFVVRLGDGRERYACCALDALGVPPMVGQRAEIRARCHHCRTSLTFSVTPEGPEPDAEAVMLWLGRRTAAGGRVADSL